MDEENKKIKEDLTLKENRLILTISEIALRKNFKIKEAIISDDLYPSLRVHFANGIIWRCILSINKEQLNHIEKNKDSFEEIVLIDYELIDADISKSNYELIFKNMNGEILLKLRETISPSKI